MDPPHHLSQGTRSNSRLCAVLPSVQVESTEYGTLSILTKYDTGRGAPLSVWSNSQPNVRHRERESCCKVAKHSSCFPLCVGARKIWLARHISNHDIIIITTIRKAILKSCFVPDRFVGQPIPFTSLPPSPLQQPSCCCCCKNSLHILRKRWRRCPPPSSLMRVW